MSNTISAAAAAVSPHHRQTPRANRVTADETAPTETEAARASKPSRRHVQRSLHQLDRLVRHAIKDAVAKAEDMDPDLARTYHDLSKDFRASLQDTFHAAGRGAEFDPAVILGGVADAMTSLTESLQAVRGADEDVVVKPVPIEDPESPVGGLVSEYA